MPRTRLWLLFLAVALGVALASAAPRSWSVEPFHGALFGSALYLGALRRQAGAPWRAAAFLALAAAQAYVLFEAAPGADVRATFVILSTWIVLESLGGRSAAPARG
jgi:hypothetical protein